MTSPAQAQSRLSPDLLDTLAGTDAPSGLAHLQAAGLDTAAGADALTGAALAQAEAAPARATRWLALAAHLAAQLDDHRSLQAQIAYAQARISLREGDLEGAARLIRQAQEIWREEGAGPALARSFLGLTQIYTLQGRYAEAEEAVQSAIDGLPPGSPQQAQARINLANLLGRQARHREALAAYDSAQEIYSDHLAQAQEQTEQAQIQAALARLAVNRANALMALDQPEQAERALQDAARHFAEAGDTLNRGRTFTNLGTLYVRTGRYSQALTALDAAAGLLLDETAPVAAQSERLLSGSKQADVLFLERANAYVALNLLAEAVQEIEQAIGLFQATGQPYELGQSHYSLGLLHLRRGEERPAQAALEQAASHFTALANGYWQNRVALTQTALAFQQGRADAAHSQLVALLEQSDQAGGASSAWDRGLGIEARLLLSRVALARNDSDGAMEAAGQAAALLGLKDAAQGDSLALPHLHLQWEHLSGCIALAAGEPAQAIQHFQVAIRMLENQRVSLPLEEFKSAYLEDKQELYSDLIFSLLAADEQPTEATIARVFAIGEQARARSLLERLSAAGEGGESQDDDRTAHARQLRGELHWLYNQMLDGQAGDDAQAAARRREIQARETALQRVEWKRTALLRQAEAVDLAALQAALAPDQQAVVFWSGRSTLGAGSVPGGTGDGGEVMAFVIDRARVRLIRHLASPDRVDALAAELRFQLGRVELGWAYVQRHGERLMAGVRRVLGELYAALFAPLAPALDCGRLLLVPHGPLHQIPLHALWDGGGYLLQRFECSYAPSGSLAVHRRRLDGHGEGADRRPFSSWAGLALTDEAIPAARQEVERAAQRFDRSRLFLDERADRAGLEEAAGADVLHLATHGLFRPDNPFFSALKLADGWIDVREIYRLPLAARLVVLSACESGVGRVRGGDEVIGLARGFLGAGAHSLLVSLWNVHDESAAALMDGFYDALQQGGTPAAALRSAQERALLAGHHPYFWAPFLVIG